MAAAFVFGTNCCDPPNCSIETYYLSPDEIVLYSSGETMTFYDFKIGLLSVEERTKYVKDSVYIGDSLVVNQRKVVTERCDIKVEGKSYAMREGDTAYYSLKIPTGIVKKIRFYCKEISVSPDMTRLLVWKRKYCQDCSRWGEE